MWYYLLFIPSKRYSVKEKNIISVGYPFDFCSIPRSIGTGRDSKGKAKKPLEMSTKKKGGI